MKDAIVIGGGAAGLNGALMLARSRRSTLVIDAGEPRNAPAAAVHGLLARDGTPPAELLAAGRDEVRRYGGEIRNGLVTTAKAVGEEFAVIMADGSTERARRLLVASGAIDVLPPIPGLAERWGRDVVHCPYCHGWEVRDQAIGVLETGPMSVHQALLFRQLSEDIVFFGAPADELTERGIRVVSEPVVAVESSSDKLTGVRLADGALFPRQALAVSSRLKVRLPDGLGLPVEDNGMGEYVPSERGGRTSVPGVWVAGNIAEPSAQVGSAAAAGALAGAMINADLVMAGLLPLAPLKK
jgi:thioredoxin reductase